MNKPGFPNTTDSGLTELDGKSWVEWRVALLRELQWQREKLAEICEAVQTHETELAVLKTKIAIYSSIAAAVPILLQVIYVIYQLSKVVK